jgi:hypothetical protein
MTITLDLTPEQEARIEARARAIGVAPAAHVLRLIDEAPPAPKGLLPGESLLDALKRAGYAGAFEFEPRPDGRQWSEVEGFE